MEFRVRLSNFSLLIFLLSLFMQVDAQHARKNKIARSPSPRPPKVRFISGNSSLKMPFELSNNLILVQARVNDSVPLWFILDTGASSTVIDSQLAKALRLKARGRVVGTGGGRHGDRPNFQRKLFEASECRSSEPDHIRASD